MRPERLKVVCGFVLLAVAGCESPDSPGEKTARPPLATASSPAAAGGAQLVLRPVATGLSPRLIDAARAEQPLKPEDDLGLEIKERPLKVVRTQAVGVEPSADAAVQVVPPSPETLVDPDLSFDGMSNADNFASFGFRVSPPDTHGDVGPNHYVQMVNLLVRVWDKAGTPLTPPFRLSSLWAGQASQCAAEDAGDPIVLYDPLADRWILSQFAFVDPSSPPYHECIAVSTTGDPTGFYYLYDFVTPGGNFPDYPKLGVWGDAYYMTTNQFFLGGSFNGAGVFAFDRARMVAGDPAAGGLYVNLDLATAPEAIGGMLPADVDGLTPPPAGAPGVFAYFIADEFGDPSDGLRLFDFHVDFDDPASSSFVERPESPVAVAPFNPLTPAGRDDLEQPPPAPVGASLDSIGDRLMQRLAYRNFGGHESLVVTHTVNVGTGTTIATHQSGVRYYELRRAGGAYGVHEQATFAPDTDNRWMASAAQDHQGNLMVGYSVSGPATFPSVRYAGRLASDPPGGLFQGERTLVAGTGVQTNTGSRWGDYSSMTVDPADDCQFWYTQEYYTAESQATSSVGWLTRIGSFRFPGCAPVGRGFLQGRVKNAQTGVPIVGAQLASADGYLAFTHEEGRYRLGMGPGAYQMTASRFGYLPATAPVSVAAGGVTTRDFLLTPVPVAMASGYAFTGEGCSRNKAVDPGETVTVELSVRNVGAADAVNLQGTLLASGGVTNPSGPRSFGRVRPGASGRSTFTFTAAGACGGSVTATLALVDAGTGRDLGTVDFEFPVGVPSPAEDSAATSSGDVALPVLDFTTVEIPFLVTTPGELADLDVSVRASHTFDADLTITLEAPDGTVIELSSGNGGSGDGYGSGAASCGGTPTTFDDEAVGSIVGAAAPFAGRFRPEQALSALDGKSIQGVWTLRIADSFGLDEGVVHCASLALRYRPQICCVPGGTPRLIAREAKIVFESFQPANGALDPGESVVVWASVMNVGSGTPAALTGVLQPGGGVVNPRTTPLAFGRPEPGGAPTANYLRFTAGGVCGGTVTPTVALSDGGASLGSVSYSLPLGTTEAATFAATGGPITIADSPRVSGVALSVPYPSTAVIAGAAGTVTGARATLNGFSHTFPSDVDVLLVAPGGRQVMLLSDAGGGTDVAGVDLTFDDAAAATVPGVIAASGTFRPTNVGGGDVFPAPAPAGVPGSTLASLAGGDPNGAWELYVVDDAGADAGSFAGWSVSVDAAVPVCVAPPSARSAEVASTEAAER